MKVVGHSDEGYVELKCHQDGLRVINHRCPMDSISFGIPSLDSPAPSPEVSPDIPGNEGDGRRLRGGGVYKSSTQYVCSACAVQGLPLKASSAQSAYPAVVVTGDQGVVSRAAAE